MKLVELTLPVNEIEDPLDIDVAATILGTAEEGKSALGISLADIKAKKPARAALDTLKQETLDSYICREWEPGDLINGIDPRTHPNPAIRNEVLRHLGIGGKILLIYEIEDGAERLVYFQYHDPNGGPISDIAGTANRMVKKQAKFKLRDKVIEQTKRALEA